MAHPELPCPPRPRPTSASAPYREVGATFPPAIAMGDLGAAFARHSGRFCLLSPPQQAPLGHAAPFQCSPTHTGLALWQRAEGAQRHAHKCTVIRPRLPHARMGQRLACVQRGRLRALWSVRRTVAAVHMPCTVANACQIKPCAQAFEIRLFQAPKLQKALLLRLGRPRQQPIPLRRRAHQGRQGLHVALSVSRLHLQIHADSHRRLGAGNPASAVRQGQPWNRVLVNPAPIPLHPRSTGRATAQRPGLRGSIFCRQQLPQRKAARHKQRLAGRCSQSRQSVLLRPTQPPGALSPRLFGHGGLQGQQQPPGGRCRHFPTRAYVPLSATPATMLPAWHSKFTGSLLGLRL